MAVINKFKKDGVIYQIDDTDDYTREETDALLSTKYQKPSGGIPKIDLASDVKSSLEKADTALQSLPAHTHDDRYYTESETDTLLSSKYQKPSGGIPKSDMASDVQSSLGKADTALQSLPAHNHDSRYYQKTETYSKSEVDEKVKTASTLKLTLTSSGLVHIEEV